MVARPGCRCRNFTRAIVDHKRFELAEASRGERASMENHRPFNNSRLVCIETLTEWMRP
jgi:hypothetical protein